MRLVGMRLTLVAAILAIAVVATSAQPVEINFAAWDNEFYQRAVETFHEKHPDIRVNLVPVTAIGLKDGIIVRILAGEIDGFAYWGHRDLLEQGMLLNLSDYLDDEYFKDFYPAIVNFFEKDGARYGVPVYLAISTHLYNRDAFDEAGLAVPRGEAYTWETFESMLRVLTRALSDGSVERYGYVVSANYRHDLSPALWSFGGRYTHEGHVFGTELLWDDAAVQAIQFWRGLAERGVTPPEAQWDIETPFVQERAAMKIVWGPPEWETYPFSIGLLPMPIGPAGRHAWVGADAYSVAVTSRHPRETIEFIKHLASEEMVRVEIGLIGRGGRIPARLSLGPEVMERAPIVKEANIDLHYMLEAAALYGRPEPYWASQEVENLLNRYWIAAYRGEIAPSAAVESAMREANAILGELP